MRSFLLAIPTALAAAVMLACPVSAAPLPTAATQRQKGPHSQLPEEERLRVALQFHPHDAKAHKQLIDLLEKKYAFRAMVTEEATWLKSNPNDEFSLLWLVSTATTALHDPEFAIAQLRLHLAVASREDDPDDYDSDKDQLASLLIKRGRPREAVPLLAELVNLHPKDAGLLADYGEALFAAGQKEDGLRALRHSLEIDPSTEIVHEDLAADLLKSGDPKGAEAEYRAAISVYNAEYKTGEPTDSAHSMLRQMVKIEAKNHSENALAEMYLDLAHVLLVERKYDEAIAETKAALDADNTDFVALYLRAEIYDAKGDLDEANSTRAAAGATIQKEAAAEFSKSPKKNRPQIDPRVIFLTDTLWNGDSGYPALPSEIVSILTPRLNSLSGPERVVLATAYFAQGWVSKGKQQWEKAIAVDPTADNAVGQANLGRDLLKADDVRDAVRHLRRAYELDPQNLTYQIDYRAATRKLKQQARNP